MSYNYQFSPINLNDWAVGCEAEQIIGVLEQWEEGVVIYAWPIRDLSEIGRIMYSQWGNREQTVTSSRILGQGRLTRVDENEKERNDETETH